jgi:signal transduction histidine kinase
MNAGAMGKVSKKHKDTFEMASGSVDRLAKVIDEFIELSEIELGNAQLIPEEVDMRAICEDVIKWVNPQLKESKLKLKSVMPDMASLITLDPAGITKVLHHLLDNAIKFSPKGTTIELQLEDRGRDIALYVKDQGPGIEAENVEKIFDCFAKFDPNDCPGKTGLGIGLTLAKGIVEMHNGEIIAASTPGKQTTFRVSIPK